MSHRKIKARLKAAKNQSLVDRLLRPELPPNLEASGIAEAQYQIDFVVKSGRNGKLNVKGTATSPTGPTSMSSMDNAQFEDLKKVLANAPGFPEDLQQRLVEAAEKAFLASRLRGSKAGGTNEETESPVSAGVNEELSGEPDAAAMEKKAAALIEANDEIIRGYIIDLICAFLRADQDVIPGESNMKCTICSVQELIRRKCGARVNCPVKTCRDIINYTEMFVHLIRNHPNTVNEWYGQYTRKEAENEAQQLNASDEHIC
uniref:SP-RING-type domain-containing protein n=1 Tax=Steinernema glaseri TaxID=37863 RepID=A0A1I7ZDR3_9BILA